MAPTEPAPVDGRILSFAEIHDAPDLREERLLVPEWGGALRLRGCTVADMEHIGTQATVKNDKGEDTINRQAYNRALFRFAVMEPILSKEQVEDIFANKSALVVKRVLDAIERLNAGGLTDAGGVAPTKEAFSEAANAFRDRPQPAPVVSPGVALGGAEHPPAEGADGDGGLAGVAGL